jgi:hypothetical protein
MCLKLIKIKLIVVILVLIQVVDCNIEKISTLLAKKTFVPFVQFICFCASSSMAIL